MHTVHLPVGGAKNSIKYAALGIMFSVNEHTAMADQWQIDLIDEFFDSLQWNETASDPTVPMASYGKLMMMVDTRNRWVYKGSVTTPPCATTVYWNVVRKVYPIKQAHFEQFKNQMKRGNIPTNFRQVQTIDNHDLHIIETVGLGSRLEAGVAVFGILFVTFAMITICSIIRAHRIIKLLGPEPVAEGEKPDAQTEL